MSTFRRRLRREDPEMAVREYTLTGFSDFLDRRRVGFVEELPPNRGLRRMRHGAEPVSDIALRSHAVQAVQKSDHRANGCPLDGRQFADADLLPVVFSEADLEQHRVLCIAGGQKCRFSGKLRDMRRHLAECVGGGVLCGKCRRSWTDAVRWLPTNGVAANFTLRRKLRTTVGDQRRRPTISRVSRTSSKRFGTRFRASRRAAKQSPTASTLRSTGSRASKATCHAKPTSRTELAAVTGTAHLRDPQLSHGRSRTLSCPCQAGRVHRNVQLACELFKNEKKEVCTRFAFILRHGDWDDHVDWPFRKKVTLTIAHPRYEDKDIGMPISVDDYAAAKKPVPAIPNSSSWTGELYWKDIDEHGYIGNKALYVNVQFE
ncbi:hypothetical protein HPB51_026639 [Rhipicephalus microplus]|uniref:TRAF1-6 MATH domain-containing protein n=1 Tax=Rhipicephalus microplus TaxID=6941 RepID=A0A9J6D2J1_RHIMP|nr:hypothetical protein HPB51_026639 [Rhipicephalus microplus]